MDTHVRRLSQRLGLTKREDPVKIERDLMKLVPREDWGRFPHLLIWHGRRICDARRPLCEECVLNDLCPSARVWTAPELVGGSRAAKLEEGTMKLRFALPLAAALSLARCREPRTAPTRTRSPSTGDSITRAFNDCWFPYVDCPSASWSTGTSSYSHYRRIQGANPGITGRSYNQAVTGADMADLYGQVQGVIARRAEYVTILMGANDVCASSEAGMTDVGVFRAQFAAAMASLTAGLPSSRVFVSSIPDIYQLFSLYRYDLGANAVWAIAGNLPVDARVPVLEPSRRRREARAGPPAEHRLQHAARAGLRDVRPVPLRRERGLQHRFRPERRDHPRLFPSIGGRADEARGGHLGGDVRLRAVSR